MQIRNPSTHIIGKGNNHEKVLRDIYKAINGKISYGQQGFDVTNPTIGLVTDNIDGNFGTTSDSGLADTQFTVTHNLNRIPIGFHVVRQNKAGSFYDSGTTWTTTQIFLKCNVANVAATFFIF